MRTLSIDIETYSDVDIGACGAYKYVDSPNFEILLFAYSFDFEPAKVIDLMDYEEIPEEVVEALFDPEVVKRAYNAPFERTCLAKHFGRPMPPEQWRCDMVLGAVCGLPLGLAAVSEALGLGEDKAKMKVGKDLIRYFCIPCKPTKSNGYRTRNLPEHAPEKWELFKAYNARDVDSENEITKMLMKYDLDENEQLNWVLDQEINDRGVKLDLELVENAIRFDEQNKEALTEEAIKLTGLSNPNSVSQIKDWLKEQEGLEVESLNKKAMPDVLEALTTEEAKAFLDLRSKLSKTSVKKYEAMDRCACSDQRAKGLFQFYGTRTGRFAGRLLQLQNFPQNHMPDLDLARQLVKSGDYETFTLLYDDVSSVLSELLRTAIIPEEGNKFIVCDFSAIEARVTAWMAHEQWRMDVFKNGGDIYCNSASQMFKVPVVKNGINGHLRQKGKVAELACIAEDSLVLTDAGLVKIQDVTTDMKLWDGEEWVNHDGVMFKGYKEVMTYEGLTATADHLVWTEEADRPMRFGTAIERKAHLLRTGDRGTAVRMGRDHRLQENMVRKEKPCVCKDKMHGVRNCKVDKSIQPDKWEVQRLSALLPTETGAEVADTEVGRCETEMYKSERSELQELRSERNPIQFPIGVGSRTVDSRQCGWRFAGIGDGQNRQQQRLRAGKHKIRSKRSESGEPKTIGNPRLQAGRMALCKKRSNEKAVSRNDERRNTCGGRACCEREEKKLETNPSKVRVYDILNCGKRHRFTVSDVLVHNCGYGGSVGALKAFGADKLGMTEEEMQDTVNKWRESSPNIVNWWWSMDRAAKRAISKKTSAYDEVGGITFSYENGLLFMGLPSGRKLCYYNARIVDGKFGNPVIGYMGTNQKTRKWEVIETYGPKLVENCVQAIARDCLLTAMRRLDEAGFKITMHIHDEVIIEEPIGGRSLSDVEAIMSMPIPWAKGLLLCGDGDEMPYYQKA